MVRELYLFRHGETEWSRSGQHTGVTDIPLTPQGEADAIALGKRMHDLHFERVFTSPRQRARRTCELTVPEPAPMIDPDLAEWDYGDYEGRRTVEILKERPGWMIFKDGAPGGETPAQIAARADSVIVRCRALEGRLAIFTHGHFGRVLAARWVGLPVGEARHFLIGTASLNILGYEHGNLAEPVIVRLNA